jgi:cysteine synthase B
MILDGERSGRLHHGRVILDATSGNTGIAYAMICASRGYHCTLALPADATEERKKILLAYGAELVLTDAREGTDGAQLFVKRMVAENPQKYFYPDQYNNNANWGAHFATTGPEIWRQTEGTITHFVTGLGTTGTFMGVTRCLRELNPKVRCISTQPDIHEHVIPGMKHMPSNIVPGIYDPKLADDQFTVGTRDAQRMVVRLAREEGLLVGVSSGANMWAALKVAAQAKAAGMNHAVVVTMFPDSAFKYLSEKFWQE